MLYTEEAVRAGLRVRDGRRVFYLPEGSRLTPAARDWLRQEGVTVVQHAETPPAAYRTPDGAAFAEKPEHMTHLQYSCSEDAPAHRLPRRHRHAGG